jgi:hypothetical protein
MQPYDTSTARAWYLLLLLPFIGVLWVPSYNSVEPSWQGIPFFYWYQFLWVLISAVITSFVYVMTREPDVVRLEDPATPLNEDLA